jgi:hypothetical protein
LDLLREGAFRLALVVVRPELTARVQCLLHPADIVAVTPRNRGLLPGLLVEKLR